MQPRQRLAVLGVGHRDLERVPTGRIHPLKQPDSRAGDHRIQLVGVATKTDPEREGPLRARVGHRAASAAALTLRATASSD
jgi:hypothetical protein